MSPRGSRSKGLEPLSFPESISSSDRRKHRPLFERGSETLSTRDASLLRILPDP